MKRKTGKEKASHLKNKISLKERNNLDYTKELCEGLDLITQISGECEPEDATKEFMQLYSMILPEDKIKRVDIVTGKIKESLLFLSCNNNNLKECVKKIYVSLNVLSKDAHDYSNTLFDDKDLPEDDMMIDICDLYESAKDRPGEEYYTLVTKYISILLENLKTAIATRDVELIQLTGLRLNLQALQLEQLYRLIL